MRPTNCFDRGTVRDSKRSDIQKTIEIYKDSHLYELPEDLTEEVIAHAVARADAASPKSDGET